MSEPKRYRMLIDGAWVDAEGGRTFESLNPATGTSLTTAERAAVAV